MRHEGRHQCVPLGSGSPPYPALRARASPVMRSMTGSTIAARVMVACVTDALGIAAHLGVAGASEYAFEYAFEYAIKLDHEKRIEAIG